MTKVLTFAAVAEAATGLALLIVPSLVCPVVVRRATFRHRRTSRARGRHRSDCFWDCQLAEPTTGRHVDLHRSSRGVPRRSRFRRNNGDLL